MLLVRVHGARPFPCCMSMSMSKPLVRVCVSVCVFVCVRVRVYKCRTVRHPISPVPEWKKLTMPGPIRYRTKPAQSGISLVRYRNEIMDAGIPMPALLSSMPMPSYGLNQYQSDPIRKSFPSKMFFSLCVCSGSGSCSCCMDMKTTWKWG
jgi:hypothetical protein